MNMHVETLTTYLHQEINAHDLSQLLDQHLSDTVQMIAASGEPWTQDQASAYHHIRRLRDLFKEMNDQQQLERA